MTEYALSEDLVGLLEKVAEKIKAEGGENLSTTLFAATEYLETKFYPEMAPADAENVQRRDFLSRLWVYEGQHIGNASWVQLGPGAHRRDPDEGGTVYEGSVLVQLGPGSTCSWYTLSTGEKVKICR